MALGSGSRGPAVTACAAPTLSSSLGLGPGGFFRTVTAAGAQAVRGRGAVRWGGHGRSGTPCLCPRGGCLRPRTPARQAAGGRGVFGVFVSRSRDFANYLYGACVSASPHTRLWKTACPTAVRASETLPGRCLCHSGRPPAEQCVSWGLSALSPRCTRARGCRCASRAPSRGCRVTAPPIPTSALFSPNGASVTQAAEP